MPAINCDPEILAIFKDQAQRHLTSINNHLLNLEKGQIETDAIKHIKASLHTLKGDARMLGLLPISQAAHKLEDIFLSLTSNVNQKILKENIDYIFKVLDRMALAIQKLPEIIEISLEVSMSTEQIETERKIAPGKSSFQIDKVEEKREHKDKDTLTVKDKSIDESYLSDYLTIKLSKIDELINMSTIFPRYASRFSFIHTELLKLKKEFEKYADKKIQQLMKGLDALLYDLAHELSFFELQAKQFQDDINQLKLVPLKTLYDQLPRLVRDIANVTGKKVNLILEGEDVELEKIIIENLKPVFIHLLRNAVDHGCQKEEERLAAGKDSENKVSVSAFNQGDSVIIEISDDGRGIDIEAIKKTALQKNLITPSQLGKLSDESIIGFIFESGFSTKEITEFSGRGVGMDVVAQVIKSMNGEITVRTLFGKGTTFAINLPIYSSYIPVTIFSINNYLYGIPSNYINAVLPYNKNNINFINEKTVYLNTKFGEIPLIDIKKIFNFENSEIPENTVIILLRYKDNLVSILVDEIVLEKKLIIKKILSLKNHLKIIIGAVLLARERAIPVLNIQQLFTIFMQKNIAFYLDQSYFKEKRKFGAKTILLVEDSPVTREREKKILLNWNLNVLEAANGKEALEILRDNEINCIITDLEMPVMNGKELIKSCKQNEQMRNIPIIVISSYDSLADEVFTLGINHFINKANFSADGLATSLRLQKIL